MAIDDYEIKNALSLTYELFPYDEITPIVINHHPQSSGGRLSRTHEYFIQVSPSSCPSLLGKPKEDEEEDRSFMRSGTGENNFRYGRWKSFYALLVDSNNKVVGVEPPPPLGNDYPLCETEEGFKRIYPINLQNEERVWRSSYETGKIRVANNEIFVTERGSVKQKIFHEDKRETLFSNWIGTDFNAGTQGTNILDSLGFGGKFDYPKSIKTLELTFWMQSFGKTDYQMIDFFGGSGTSAHAVINNNREDKENKKRKFIIVEQGEYFDTVIKPRIQKVVYASDWKDCMYS